MRRARLSFIASVIVFAIYLYLFRNNQLLTGIYLRNTKEVVQILDTAMLDTLKMVEIVAATLLMGISGLAFGRLINKQLSS